MAAQHPCPRLPAALLPSSLLLPATSWGRSTFPRDLTAGKLEVKMFTSFPDIYHRSKNKIQIRDGRQVEPGSLVSLADGWFFLWSRVWALGPQWRAGVLVGSAGSSPCPLCPAALPRCRAALLTWETVPRKSFPWILCLICSLPSVLFLEQLLNQTWVRHRSLKRSSSFSMLHACWWMGKGEDPN